MATTMICHAVLAGLCQICAALLPSAALLCYCHLCSCRKSRCWKGGRFSTYHVALGLAVVTVGAILGLEVGGNGALGGHCV